MYVLSLSLGTDRIEWDDTWEDMWANSLENRSVHSPIQTVSDPHLGPNRHRGFRCRTFISARSQWRAGVTASTNELRPAVAQQLSHISRSTKQVQPFAATMAALCNLCCVSASLPMRMFVIEPVFLAEWCDGVQDICQ